MVETKPVTCSTEPAMALMLSTPSADPARTSPMVRMTPSTLSATRFAASAVRLAASAPWAEARAFWPAPAETSSTPALVSSRAEAFSAEREFTRSTEALTSSMEATDSSAMAARFWALSERARTSPEREWTTSARLPWSCRMARTMSPTSSSLSFRSRSQPRSSWEAKSISAKESSTSFTPVTGRTSLRTLTQTIPPRSSRAPRETSRIVRTRAVAAAVMSLSGTTAESDQGVPVRPTGMGIRIL